MVGATGALRIVVAHLRIIHPRTATPQEIHLTTGLSHAAIKKALQRDQLAGGAHTVRVRRGEYRAFMDSDLLRAVDIPEPEVHNVKIVAPLSPGTRGAPFAADAHGPENVHQRRMDWQGRKVTVQYEVRKAKKNTPRRPVIVIHLGASMQPLAVQEFEAYWSFCAGLLSSFGVDPDSPNVRVREVETNCDIPLKRLALKGVESMSIHGFRKGLLKVYNKRSLGVMRTEACLWPTDLHPREAIGVMEEAFFRNARPSPRAAPQPPGGEPNPHSPEFI